MELGKKARIVLTTKRHEPITKLATASRFPRSYKLTHNALGQKMGIEKDFWNSKKEEE